MIQIDDKIISFDLFEVHFCCDLAHCKGICCVEGNAGAPLEAEEVDLLEQEYPAYKPYMKPEGIEAIERQGFMIPDAEGDYTTPLVDNDECAYSIRENGITLCAIEKAWREGRTSFRKPVSCHLYPIRLSQFGNGTTGLNYHRWAVCNGALVRGAKEGIPLFRTLREPLIRRFGGEFYDALEEAYRFLQQGAETT